jgi:hypothetical protein
MATEIVVWPCETAAAAKALLPVPKAGGRATEVGEHPHPKITPYVPGAESKAVYSSTAIARASVCSARCFAISCSTFREASSLLRA